MSFTVLTPKQLSVIQASLAKVDALHASIAAILGGEPVAKVKRPRKAKKVAAAEAVPAKRKPGRPAKASVPEPVI
jgi:hypothetical protein